MSKTRFFASLMVLLAPVLWLQLPRTLFAAETAAPSPAARYQHEDWVRIGVVDVLTDPEIQVRDAFSRLPEKHVAAVQILYPEEVRNAGKLIERLDDYLFNAEENKAAQELGMAYNKQYRGSRIALGELSRILQPLAGGADNFALFLSHFLNGYQNNEVLMFTTAGIDDYAAYSPGRPFPWQEAPGVVSDVDMLDRIYSTEEVTMIPFLVGEHFEVDLWGKTGETAKLWKIMSGSVKEMEWVGGDWQKVILVYHN